MKFWVLVQGECAIFYYKEVMRIITSSSYRMKLATKFVAMPSSMTYFDVAHGKNDDVIFWLWTGNQLHLARGRGSQRHDEIFSDLGVQASWETSGRIDPNRNTGTVGRFPDLMRSSEMMAQQLSRHFPNVTFFVSDMRHVDLDTLDF